MLQFADPTDGGIFQQDDGKRLEELEEIVKNILGKEVELQIRVVSEKVQDRVKTAIENMTGLHVLDVNIKIASVNMEAEEQ